MNIDNINKLANHLEALPDAYEVEVGFSMVTYFCDIEFDDYGNEKDHTGHDCGTTACIAGHAVHLLSDCDLSNGSIKIEATRLLELEQWSASALFEPIRCHNNITIEDAVKTLRHLAKTGKVDWEVN